MGCEIRGAHLRGQEHVVAPDAGGTQAFADLTLVLINLGGVDVAIAELDGLLDDAGAGATAQLPRPQSAGTDDGAVGLDRLNGRALRAERRVPA